MIRRFIDRLRAVAGGKQAERELDDELRFHFDKQTEANLSLGMTPEEARRQALVALGGIDKTREEYRDALGVRLLSDLVQDVCYALRQMRRSPGFTAVVILTLALGIGANTALFSVVDAVLLRPLPFRNADRLVMVWETNQARGFSRNVVSFPNYEDWQRQSPAIAAFSPLKSGAVTLTGQGPAEPLLAAVVSARLFAMLGVQPIGGRVFQLNEDRSGADRVVLISRYLWQTRFGGEFSAVGHQLVLNDRTYAVVGVVPDFELPDLGKPEVWLPLSAGLEDWRQLGNLADRGSRFLEVIAEVQRGVTIEQARADLQTIAARLADAYPQSNRGWSVGLVPLQEQVTGNVRPALLALRGAVGLVLLIACANVANLLLARAAARQREMAVRLALGASPLRLIRQMLTESVLLSLIAGGCGCLLAAWAIKGVTHFGPQTLPRLNEVRLDGAVIVVAVLISLFTGIVFGIAPALAAMRSDVQASLQHGGRAGSGVRQQRLRQVFVGVEIALSVMLVVGASLAVRSFLRLMATDPGFAPEHAFAALVVPPPDMSPARRAALYEELLARVNRLPGVESAGATQVLPLRPGGWTTSFAIEGEPDAAERPEVGLVRVAGDYFCALRIPLLRGRAFTPHDRAGAPGVVIINEAFARRFFLSRNPIGARLRLSNTEPPIEVVGVVGNANQQRLDLPATPALYVPYAQQPRASLTLVIRAAGDPAGLASALRQVVSDVDRNQPVAYVTTMDELIDQSLAPRRYPALLLAAFAVLALILAAVGVYGVMSYAVAQRTREIGIRMALGAQWSDVIVLVLRQALMVSCGGIAVGSVAALSLARIMRGLLYGITSTDPVTFIGVPLLLLAISVLAAFMPAQKASRTDPVITLRYE
jgi:predicted permease